jgi:hypothetical protein
MDETPKANAGLFQVEIPGYAALIAVCTRLTDALQAIHTAPRPELPEGVRPDIHRVAAVLSLDSWQEVVRWAATLGVDLRDLTAGELAYLERVTVKTAADWRSRGEGPKYRCQGYILYPLADFHAWRRNGRQTTVGQRQRKGRRVP